MDKEKKKKILDYALLGGVSLLVGLGCGFGIGSCSSAYVAQANIEQVAITHRVENRRATTSTYCWHLYNNSLESVDIDFTVYEDQTYHYHVNVGIPSGEGYALYWEETGGAHYEITAYLEWDSDRRLVYSDSYGRQVLETLQPMYEFDDDYPRDQNIYITNYDYYAGESVNIDLTKHYSALGFSDEFMDIRSAEQGAELKSLKNDAFSIGGVNMGEVLITSKTNQLSGNTSNKCIVKLKTEISGLPVYMASNSPHYINGHYDGDYGLVGGFERDGYTYWSWEYPFVGFWWNDSDVVADYYIGDYFLYGGQFTPQLTFNYDWSPDLYYGVGHSLSDSAFVMLDSLTVTSFDYIRYGTPFDFSNVGVGGTSSHNWFDKVANLLSKAFGAWFGIFGLEVLPGVSLGLLVLAPIFAMLIVVIFKAVKQ